MHGYCKNSKEVRVSGAKWIELWGGREQQGRLEVKARSPDFTLCSLFRLTANMAQRRKEREMVSPVTDHRKLSL